MDQKPLKPLIDWALFRFSVVGCLLSRPPAKGELQKELLLLSQKTWHHPITGKLVKFGTSTLERWYYNALKSNDPVAALARKVRKDAGQTWAISPDLLAELCKQYKWYSHWSYQLHYDNLSALVKELPELGEMPSYATIRRRMIERGLRPCKKNRQKRTPGMQKAAQRLEQREVRGFEAEYVNALWHLDFHEASRKVLDSKGTWHKAKALCVLDDRSRLCCHIQWYLDESSESLFHGLMQAFHKRGLPRSLMTDNGAAMVATETRNGLLRLGIHHETILAYSPYQNGKQENFWAQLEGRLLAMLTQMELLSLDFLNQVSLAWIEQEYNRKINEEMGTSPLNRMLAGPDVTRPSPDSEAIRFAFTLEERRLQRRSDGTIKIKGVRFEIPSRYRHFETVFVRYPSWDLSMAWLVDRKTGIKLSRIYPQDKAKNADGRRRYIGPVTDMPVSEQKPQSIPPLLRKIIADYAATGLPPAYLPKEEQHHEQ